LEKGNGFLRREVSHLCKCSSILTFRTAEEKNRKETMMEGVTPNVNFTSSSAIDERNNKREEKRREERGKIGMV
jgi:hypothetical protein